MLTESLFRVKTWIYPELATLKTPKLCVYRNAPCASKTVKYILKRLQQFDVAAFSIIVSLIVLLFFYYYYCELANVKTGTCHM